MVKKFPLHPVYLEHICWDCNKYCSTDALGYGNNSGCTRYPAELLSGNWYEPGDWGVDADVPQKSGTPA